MRILLTPEERKIRHNLANKIYRRTEKGRLISKKHRLKQKESGWLKNWADKNREKLRAQHFKHRQTEKYKETYKRNRIKFRSSDKYKKYCKEYANRPYVKERARKSIDAYQQTSHYKELRKAYDLKRRIFQKEKLSARKAISFAVKKGRLPRIETLLCEKCGAQARERHHHKGYAKEHWFDAIPLCFKCHVYIHNQ